MPQCIIGETSNLHHCRKTPDTHKACCWPGCLTVTVTVAAGSEVAANMDSGSVPSRTLLRGSITELEEEEEVDEVLPFRLTFFVFDSVTCGESCTVEVI